jgi:hypothetical protein
MDLADRLLPIQRTASPRAMSSFDSVVALM